MKAYFVLAAVLIAASVAILESFQSARAAGGDHAAVVYTHGVLRVNIPYDAPRPGVGQLTVELLNPEDAVLGHSEKRTDVPAGKGLWQADLKLIKPVPVDELVWHRLRYSFTYADKKDAPIQGIESVSEILRMPVVHIVGQQSYLTGGQAAVRVVAIDSKNEPIAGSSSVRVELLTADDKSRTLFFGPLNSRGTGQVEFRFPAGLAGAYRLHYVVDTPIGTTENIQPVRLEDRVSILLTTEKPVYQPGQTIHVRALALDRANHEAVANRKLTFELEDSRGNKVFKQTAQTSKFGVASAEFALADEVNLGTYHLRALMDDGGNIAETALNVQKYVLPKFKVALDFSQDGKKEKHGYRPGDHVTGTVRANYFFGKPVDGAEIAVKASSLDVSVFDVGSVQGKTDAEGAYRFDIKLPGYFAGRPLSQGAARVLIEASVKDSAGHSESRGEPVTVSESPLIVTVIPEGGKLIPGLENQLFVLTSYADGKPATADVRVRAAGNSDQLATTDSGGVAIVKIKPGAQAAKLEVEAKDKEGNRAESTVQPEVRLESDQILLRTEHAVYRAGDRIQLHVFSSKERGAAYVDVIKDGQTILTRDLDITNGKADLSFTATPEMAGALDFNAYLFGRDATPVGDHRLVFVQPADDLRIEASSDSPAYKPGQEARIRFRVTNSRGEGVQAALGLQVVDEAVFALAEKQPGFAKVFFYLEQEALKPRYEIHSIGMPDIVEPVALAKVEQRDRAVRALFAATEVVKSNKFETEFGRTVPQAKYAEYSDRYRTRFIYQLNQLSAADLSEGKQPELRDAWNTNLRIERASWDPQRRYFTVKSAGPDRRFDTPDDVASTVQLRTRMIVGRPSSGPSAIAIAIEKDRGPYNGRAEVSGTVVDRWGGALDGAYAMLNGPSGNTRAAVVGVDGRFQFTGLSAGDYEIRISTESDKVSKAFKLMARDRAIVTATLAKEPASTKVAVNERREQMMVALPEQARFARFDGGVIGGIAGGAPGGGGGRFLATPQAQMPMALIAKTSASNGPMDFKVNSEPAAPRTRSYFPEALYINPEIVTDADGRASIVIPMADSITTWRMAMTASTTHGALGSAVSSLKVFQDFFVDLDLPVTLTQGDRVEIPVAIYNYAGSRGNVKLQLQQDDWFTLANDAADKTVAVDPDRVGASHFTIEAKRIGKFKLTLAAKMNGGIDRADIVIREIEVIPNGREQNIVFNGRLENTVQHALNFPPAAIPDASAVVVRLYPGPLSQVVEGMDGLLRMPFGCFEQTSSSTYPNVLALDYMKRTKKLTPEVHAKAEGFIANGYQRLLTFEVPGGGFSWFGAAPANKILTSYGLMEFFDMSKVHDVDPKLIQRTQQWLAAQQQPDGSWKPDTSFINEGATNRYNSDLLRITAYIAWALENSGYQGPAVDRAKQFVSQHLGGKIDSYTLAVLANFAADGNDRELTRQAMQLLLNARIEKGEQIWWTSEETGVYATGESASIETTGLAVQGLLKGGQASGIASKALSYIASKKGASGEWGTTQATIMALRALLVSTEKGAADVRGIVEIALNGKPVQKLVLTPENNDLLHQFIFKNVDASGANHIDIRFDGKGGLAYQVVGRHFVPWNERPSNEPLAIAVAYDRTRLAQDDIATATATVKNNLPKIANMVMVDLGIPPGFDLLSEDLQAYQEKSAGQKSGKLEKFTQTATQAILYFDSIAAGDTVTLKFRLRAKYPIRARTFQSRVYEYYDPDVNSTARPVQLEVRKK
jgi:uncharacterized protein YfaS (alpha-2-macroglobulin family)